ncbi:hypothetical protein Tco_1533792 [Tanacetum coccineum]
MARQCTKPKRPKNSAWFKEKMLLAQALESSDVLDEKQMTSLVDNGDTIITFQASHTDSDIDITSDSNVISYEQYLKEIENGIVQDTTSTAQQDALIMFVIELMSNQVAQFKKHDAWYVIDTEETLKLVEESNLKMHAKQNDPVAKEKKVNITPIDYGALNRLFEHFAKHFVPQKQLSAEQDFWLPISKPVYENPPVQPEPIHKDIPRELHSISVVKHSLMKIRSQLNDQYV